MFRAFLLVGAGGAAGSMLRYGISLLINRTFNHPLPVATLLVNLSGCLLIGLLFGTAERHAWLQGNLLLLLATGFCGGFTTFSTFAAENVKLLNDHQSGMALLYTLLSVFLGIALCKAGIWLAGA